MTKNVGTLDEAVPSSLLYEVVPKWHPFSQDFDRKMWAVDAIWDCAHTLVLLETRPRYPLGLGGKAPFIQRHPPG
jgi:hypothetical protein